MQINPNQPKFTQKEITNKAPLRITKELTMFAQGLLLLPSQSNEDKQTQPPNECTRRRRPQSQQQNKRIIGKDGIKMSNSPHRLKRQYSIDSRIAKKIPLPADATVHTQSSKNPSNSHRCTTRSSGNSIGRSFSSNINKEKFQQLVYQSKEDMIHSISTLNTHTNYGELMGYQST